MGNPLDVVAEAMPPVPDPFCRWCGRPAGGCDQSTCHGALDAPMACPTCGRRIRVVVIPTGYTATCKEHGQLDP